MECVYQFKVQLQFICHISSLPQISLSAILTTKQNPSYFISSTHILHLLRCKIATTFTGNNRNHYILTFPKHKILLEVWQTKFGAILVLFKLDLRYIINTVIYKVTRVVINTKKISYCIIGDNLNTEMK